jgi:hypothetical protein
MRVTGRWVDEAGKNGALPGKFATAQDAEDAARKFMEENPAVTTVSIRHETGGWLTDVDRSGKSSNGWRAQP